MHERIVFIGLWVDFLQLNSLDQIYKIINLEKFPQDSLLVLNKEDRAPKKLIFCVRALTSTFQL